MENSMNEKLSVNSLFSISDHLEIPDGELMFLQTIVDLVAQIGEARAGLITRVQNNEIKTFLASQTDNNPFKLGFSEPLKNSGLYCERVIRENKPLLVPNALESEEWKNNPDLQYGLLCYLGFPIRMPDNSIFGTICILDDKVNHFSSLNISLVEKMRDLVEAHLKLLHSSSYDALTSLYNRSFLYEIIVKEIKRADRYNMPITMLVFDVDHFKEVNDHFGHLIGDEVLKNIALIIKNSFRSIDVVARYGGEEFTVLMPNIIAENAVIAAERTRVLIENGHCLPCGKVTVSVGVAEYIHGETFNDWFKRADAALYEAKNNGRNQVMAYQDEGSLPVTCVNIQWKNEWNSGNKQIDREHRQIVDLGNQLINLSLAGSEQDKIMAQLELTLQHISSHFRAEEEMLSRAAYPDYEKHKKLHDDLILKSLILKESYAQNKIKQSAFFSFIVDDVIVGHLEQEDSKFFPVLQKKNAGISTHH